MQRLNAITQIAVDCTQQADRYEEARKAGWGLKAKRAQEYSAECQQRFAHNRDVRERLKKQKDLGVQQRKRERAEIRPARRMWAHVRRRALRDNIVFTITPQDLYPLPSVCPVCGKVMGAGAKCLASDRRSLDKIQPQLGYVPGNVAVICVSCNSVKGQSTPEQLVALVKWLHKVYPAWLLITENP